MIGFHQWGISRLRIESVDTQERIIHFTGTTYGKSWYPQFPEDDRFFVEDVKEELSEPGEWYLDRPTGVLTYIPKPGENPEEAVVVAGALHRRRLHTRAHGKQLGLPHEQQRVPPALRAGEPYPEQ